MAIARRNGTRTEIQPEPQVLEPETVLEHKEPQPTESLETEPIEVALNPDDTAAALTTATTAEAPDEAAADKEEEHTIERFSKTTIEIEALPDGQPPIAVIHACNHDIAEKVEILFLTPSTCKRAAGILITNTGATPQEADHWVAALRQLFARKDAAAEAVVREQILK